MTTDDYTRICRYLRDLVEGTQWEGHIYAVGGCCRDQILGVPIKDVDLAVDLPLGGVNFVRWLRKRRLLAAAPVFFIKYSTAMFRLKKFPDIDLEIVQTRSAQYTPETRENPALAFGSLEDDCMRRDLTINSLFYDISRERLIDITGRGVTDINACRLATPVAPDMTFEDDPVRILRLIRFSCALGWPLSADIIEAMRRHAPHLADSSRERIRGEVTRMMGGPDPVKALELMAHIGALPYVLPPVARMISTPTADGAESMWQRALRTVAMMPADTAARFAALLHDITGVENTHSDRSSDHGTANGRAAARLLKHLRYDPALVAEIKFLILNHDALCPRGRRSGGVTDRRLRRLAIDCATPQRLDTLVALIRADAATSGDATRFDEAIERLYALSQNEKPAKPAAKQHQKPQKKSKSKSEPDSKPKRKKRKNRRPPPWVRNRRNKKVSADE